MTRLASLNRARDTATRTSARFLNDPRRHRRYLVPLLAVGGASALMLPARGALGVLNVALIYLLVCFALALILGAGPAVVGAVLSFFAYNLFFIPPYHRLTIARTDHVFALFVYLGVALVTAQLVAQVQARTAEAARERARLAEEAAKAEALAQSDELKSALLAAVSHDLRTPLATIKTVGDLAARPGGRLEPAGARRVPAGDRRGDGPARAGWSATCSTSPGSRAGSLKPDKEWYDVAEVVEDVAGRLAAARPAARARPGDRDRTGSAARPLRLRRDRPGADQSRGKRPQVHAAGDRRSRWRRGRSPARSS